MKAGIIGTGYYVPPKIVTNHDLEKIMNTSDDWIVSRTGIRERRYAENESTSDLAVQAALKALAAGKVGPDAIEMVILATITPDYPWPATACLVAQKLGLGNVPAFDISAACTGFIYALALAKSLVESGAYNNILLIGVEKFSAFMNPEDRNISVLFADGAGACLVGNSKESEIVSVSLGSDGSKAGLLCVPGGGSVYPTNQQTIIEKLQFMKMDGKEVFKNAVLRMPQALDEALQKASLTAEQLDFFIAHQANIRIIDYIAKKYNWPPEKVIINIQKYGNTSAATIPLALAEAIEEGKIHKGSLVGMTAFGAGLTWGGAIVKI